MGARRTKKHGALTSEGKRRLKVVRERITVLESKLRNKSLDTKAWEELRDELTHRLQELQSLTE